jgi:hypothetical protein
MPHRSEAKPELVFVRSKRTKQIDIRRANDVSRLRSSPPMNPNRALHYVGLDMRHVCRCSNPKRHDGRTISVASESAHLNASLMLYMNRHNLESCTTTDFQNYRRRREAQWAKEGVFVDHFHYANSEKTIVCRCTQPDRHAYGASRNPEILEKCAEFFSLNKTQTRVSKQQWKLVESDYPPPPYVPEARFEFENSRKPKNFHSRGDSREQAHLASKREMKMRSTAEPLVHHFAAPHKRSSATQGESEMPPKVWQKARPSLWKTRDGLSSTASTPLGSSFASPLERPHEPAAAPLGSQQFPWGTSHTGSGSTSWSQVQRDAGFKRVKVHSGKSERNAGRIDSVSDVRSTRTGAETVPISKLPQYQIIDDNETDKITVYDIDSDEGYSDPFDLELAASQSPPTNYYGYTKDNVRKETAEKEVLEYLPQMCYSDEKPSISMDFGEYNGDFSVRLSELPVQTPTELPAESPRQRDTLTLKTLEGRKWAYTPELEAKVSKLSAQARSIPNRMSGLTYNPYLIDLLLEQVSRITGSLTPEKDKQIHHVNAISSEKPVPGTYFQPYNEQSEILKSVFINNTALTDRIEADRKAIFGAQCTPLLKEICIDFLQRSDTAKCKWEEEVAVAQLLLLKDHIGVHAQETFNLWEVNRAEPDWYANVIQPSVQLFQGWNICSFRSLFSMSHQVFLEVIAWAELVRLMKISQLVIRRTQGEDAVFPRLVQLRHRFIEARHVYDEKKKSLPMSRFEALGCDRIVSYVVALAMG